MIHQRLFIGALLASEWPTDLAELHRVLKPGGIVQLFEVSDHYPPATPLHARLVKVLTRLHKPLLYDCGVQLPRMLGEAGFVDVRVVGEGRVALPVGRGAGENGERGKVFYLGAFRGMKRKVLQMDWDGEDEGVVFKSEKEYDEFLDEIEKEWDSVEGGRMFPVHLICARKPLN